MKPFNFKQEGIELSRLFKKVEMQGSLRRPTEAYFDSTLRECRRRQRSK